MKTYTFLNYNEILMGARAKLWEDCREHINICNTLTSNLKRQFQSKHCHSIKN